MKNFVFTGSSGVGKTFLEEELEKTGPFFQLPKYTNRPQRPGENSHKTICLTTADFTKLKKKNKYFFTLEYCGFHYGWQVKDLEARPNFSKTLSITLESLPKFLKTNQTFIPVLLYINNNGLKLIKERMLLRENFWKLPDKFQKAIRKKVNLRLNLARKEMKEINKYLKVIKRHQGMAYEIENNETVFSKIIPTIIKL